MREYTYQLRLIMFTIAFWTMAAMLISLVGMIVWKHSIDTFYYDDPLSKLPR